jgi:hypothetical protein
MEKKKYLENLESSDDEEPIYIPKGKKGVVSARPDQDPPKTPKLSIKKPDIQPIKDIEYDEPETPKPKVKKVKEHPVQAVEMVDVKPVKKKREVSEATKENLRKGREALKLYWEEQRQKKEEMAEKYAIKKANKIINQKMKIKKELACEDMSSEEEEPMMIVKQEKKKPSKKPARKQTIIIQQEPDESEEEDEEPIYKTKTMKKQNKEVYHEPVQQNPLQKNQIVFF